MNKKQQQFNNGKVSRKVAESMISIKYTLVTKFYENEKDEKPAFVKETYLTKTAAQKEMTTRAIEEINNWRKGMVGEDYAITWYGDDKNGYTERFIVVDIKK